ncbi:hypothetical protein R1flu_023905 [Riccia fluitans]|uniref:Uncharacterized protein n=1 Tax=Riccia fluitans TaxID=41844 RepID=A0ABD1XU73_9MARC
MASALSSSFKSAALLSEQLLALALEQKNSKRKRDNCGDEALSNSKNQRTIIKRDRKTKRKSTASQSQLEDTGFWGIPSKRMRHGEKEQALVVLSGGLEKSKKIDEKFAETSSRSQWGPEFLLASGCKGFQELPVAKTETRTLRRELSFSDWLVKESISGSEEAVN